MPIYKGAGGVNMAAIYKGTTSMRRVYKGSTLVWEKPGGDPLFSFVKILVYGEGADGSTTFTDHSPVGRALSAQGNAQHDTGVDVEGQSILLDGSGDYISASNAAGLQVGTLNDFCVEAYIRITDLSHINTIAGKRDVSGAEEFTFQVSASGILSLNTFGSGAARLTVVGGSTLSTHTVYHVAGTREGTTGRVFVNGVQDGSATQSGTVTTNSEAFAIGRNGFDATRNFEGNLNWFRFTVGHARYTSNFTPPTPPLPAF